MSAELLQGVDWHSYGQPDTYTIDASEYNQHLKNEIILQKLMEAGVHNFEGFEAAMAAAQEELK